MTLLKKFNQAPFELKAFAIFAMLTTLLSYILPLILEKDIWKKTIKYTGWSPALGYMFSLIMLLSPLYQSNYPNYKNVYYQRYIKPQWLISLTLVFHIFSGFQQQLLVTERRNETNPYLMVSEYQYIWTILIPAFWILVILLSSNIKRFYEGISQESK
jgi:hypothetical protein